MQDLAILKANITYNMPQEVQRGSRVTDPLILNLSMKGVGGKRHASPALSPTRGRDNQRREGA